MTDSKPDSADYSWGPEAEEGLSVLGKNQAPLPAPPVVTGQVPVGSPGPDNPEPPPCDAHREVQHRDRRPPWCDNCGWSHGRPAVPPRKYR